MLSNASDILKQRRKLIGGELFQIVKCSGNTWRHRIPKLSVFISSTFTDTQLERDVLLTEILSSLSQIGLKHGVEVVFVDLRFGIKNISTLNHETWEICRREVQRCSDDSLGIFFLSLQSEKYGNTLLPRTIYKTVLDDLTNKRSDFLDKIQESYSLDTNAVPAVYVLRNLENIKDHNFWDQVVPRLLDFFRDVPVDCTSTAEIVVGSSVTEWEAKYAASLDRSSNPLHSRLLWLHREFNGGVPSGIERPNFCDTEILEKRQKLKALKHWMRTTIPTDRVHDFCDLPFTSYLDKDDIWVQHLSRWESVATAALRESLDSIIKEKEDWDEHGPGCGLPGDEASEMLRHCAWAADKIEDFFGREDLITEAVHQFLKCDEEGDFGQLRNCDDIGGIESQFRAVSLCLVGRSGAGKTALMAKIAAEISLLVGQQQQQAQGQVQEQRVAQDSAVNTSPVRRPVIIRFCGTSPDSSSALTLLRSLSRQIHFAVGHEMNKSKDVLSMNYEAVVEHFHSLLHGHPVVLFIDSLDQLSDEHAGRSELRFLRNIRPHKLTRIIVSTLPDELAMKEGVRERGVRSYYGCETLLRQAGVRCITVGTLVSQQPTLTHVSHLSQAPCELHRRSMIQKYVSLIFTFMRAVLGSGVDTHNNSTTTTTTTNGGSSSSSSSSSSNDERVQHKLDRTRVDEVKSLIESLLSRQGRCLTPLQFQLLMDRVQEEPTVLYIRLALLVVRQWHSDMKEDQTILEGGVRNLAMQIFEHTEKIFGQELTKACFGFLTYSVEGVSDVEMCDLLTLHDGVMREVTEYNSAVRLPLHVWLRLRESINGLVSEREGGCWGWYHRQLREAAEVRYKGERGRLHATMGCYFSNCIDKTTRDEKRIKSQPFVLRGHENVISGTRDEQSAPCPTDDENDLAVWFSSSAAVNRRRCVEAGYHLIAADMHASAVAELCSLTGVRARAACGQVFVLLSQLTQLPLDNPRAAHYLHWVRQDANEISRCPELNVISTCLAQPVESEAREDCMTLLAIPGWRLGSVTQREHWVRSRSMGQIAGFGLLQNKLTGHKNAVNCTVWDSQNSRIASASSDKTVRVWDAASGQLQHTCEGHSSGLNSVCWSANGSCIASGSSDRTVRVWDAQSGRRLVCLQGHAGEVTAVGWSGGSDDGRIASASLDGTVRIWTVGTWQHQFTLEDHKDGAVSVTWSCTGDRLASGSLDRTVRIWNSLSGGLIHVLEGHKAAVCSVSWHPDGSRIASGSADMSVRIWEAEKGDLLHFLEGRHQQIHSICWSSDGSRVAAGCADRTIAVWDAALGMLERTLPAPAGKVMSVSWSSDGSRIVSGSTDAIVRVWDVASVWLSRVMVGHAHPITAVSWSNASCRIASSSTDTSDGSIRIHVWEASTGRLERTLMERSGQINSICWNPIDTLIASASNDSMIRVRNVSTGRLVRTLRGHTGAVESIDWCGTGTAIASGSSDQTVKVWDMDTGLLALTLQGHTAGVTSVCWRKSSKYRLVSGSVDCTVRIWDTQAGRVDCVLRGHDAPVRTVSCSGDGVYIASGADDRSVRVWDAGRVELVHTLKGHTLGVTAVCWSADSRRIASGAEDKKVRVWDAHSGSLDHILARYSGKRGTVSWSGEGTKIAFAYEGNTVKVLDVVGTRVTQSTDGHTGAVNSVCWSNDSMRVLSGAADNAMKIWGASSGQLLHTFVSAKGSTKKVFLCLQWSPDNSQIVCGSEDCTVALWDAKSGLVRRVLKGHTRTVRSVAWSHDGAVIASGSGDKTVRLWDTVSGRSIFVFDGHDDRINSVCWNGTSNLLASGSEDKTVRLWCVGRALRGHTAGVKAVECSRDGTRIASGSWDKTVRIWGIASGQLEVTLEGHSGDVTSVSWSHDDLLIVSGSWDCSVRVWDIETRQSLCTMEGHTSEVNSVCWSGDSACVASASSDCTVRVWDATTGRMLSVLHGHTRSVTSVRWSHDNTRIASGSCDKTVRVWNVVGGCMECVLTSHEDRITSVSWRIDDTQIASASSDKTIKVWDLPSGCLQRTLVEHTDGVNSVCWSEDGSRLASGSWDKTVKVWDTQSWTSTDTHSRHSAGINSVSWARDGISVVSGSWDMTIRISGVPRVLAGHTAAVKAVAWSHEKALIASGSSDSTVRVWNAVTGDVMRVLVGHTNWVVAVSWSHDGERVVSGSSDQSMRVWNVTLGVVERILEGHTGSVLSMQWRADDLCIASGSADTTVRVWDAVSGLTIG